MRKMRIIFNAIIDPKDIKKLDKTICIYTNIYLDKDKKYPLIEIDTNNNDILHDLGITRFISIDGNWACEAQSGQGAFFHKFNGITYHRNFNEDIKKDGNLHLYVQDRRLYI